ncbi:hypothetical protein DSM104443_00585 [Usitatibacter rugosus]|uniref:DUF2059 domain-containing protein n=1 Tax=Usitatibacter rugosus TaxID=2732067 RepID=A0A6M4GR33_9PROT|nr:hypothetical protein [Usitatibacter rugosus]QJR09536.1 hypothetical protein DSM104443_00585 [Usitatibacter rugosus]
MIRIFLALLALTLLPSGGAFAQDTRRTDELMKKSGLWKQLEHYDTLILSGLETELGKSGVLVDRNGLKKAATSFSADNLRRDVRLVLDKEMTGADEAEVLIWLSSDIGKRLTGIEEKFGDNADSAATQRQQQAIAEFVKKVPESRLALVKRMTSALDAGNATAKAMGNMTIAIAYGAAMATGGEAEIAAKLRREFDAERPQMALMMERLMIATYAYMYRGVSDADLGRYVDFIESPAGLRYHDASSAALEQALTLASLKFGQELGELAKKAPNTKRT